MLRLISIKSVVYVLLTLLFLYGTKHYASLPDSIINIHAHDAYEYMKIATSAPKFPVEPIPYHFAQRWLPHYLIGWVAYTYNIEIPLLYSLCVAVLCFAIMFIYCSTLSLIMSDDKAKIISFLIIALSPFTFRMFIYVPPLMADLIFMLGLALVVRGIIAHQIIMVIVGIVIATFGKQMSLLMLPGALLGVWFISGEYARKSRRFLRIIKVLSIVTLTYTTLTVTSKSFSLENSITPDVLFSIFSWINSDKFSLYLLCEHMARIFVPLAVPLVFVWAFTESNNGGFTGLITRAFRSLSDSVNLALLLMFLGGVAYSFFPGPLVQMGNQSRYVGLVLFPMVVLISRGLSKLKLSFSYFDFFLLFVIFTVYSFHHRYSAIQMQMPVFVVIHLAAILMFFLWAARKANKII